MSLPGSLDSPSGPRTWSLTDELLAAFDDGDLWDEYGIDSDIVVCEHECLL